MRRMRTRCPSCQTDNSALAVRCCTCGASLGSSPPVSNLPPALPERREATILFADLTGFTQLTQEVDVEEVALIMNAIKDGAAEIVHAYGGIVTQFVGDEVMAVFGVPHGHEDDPRRAVSAAHELHAFVRSARIARLVRGVRDLAFHTGIDSGVVLAQSRDVRDGVFQVSGMPVNVAARLRAEADHGEILVSETTHQAIAPFFRTEQLAPRTLKGMAGSMTPYRVEAPDHARSAFDLALERGLTPYVGRRAELAKLESYLANAGRGRAQLVSVVGPPGVGKTRLLHELISRARSRGFVVLHGQCQSYGNIPPFQPFIDTVADAVGLANREDPEAARQVAEGVRALDPALLPHLPVYLYLLSLSDGEVTLPASMRGPALRRAVFAALSALLITHARKHPVLVVIEDWHWADEASDGLFRELARATRNEASMAVVTYRGEQMTDGRRPLSNHHLALEPFGEAGTAKLLRELLQSEQWPEGLTAYVHRITDGSPFFIEEVCHALRESGALKRVGSGWTLTRSLEELAAPSSVQAMVRARVDRLNAEDKELLKLASVIGAEFPLDLLELLYDSQEALPPFLGRLEQRAHILQISPGTYRFKHAIVQDVVYNTLLLQRRKSLHALIAKTLEARPGDREHHFEALAHHYGRSDERESAIRYADLAGRKAERSSSVDQARRQYGCAIDWLDALEPTPERMRKRVDLSLRWAAALVHNPVPGQLQVLQKSLEYAEQLKYGRGLTRCLCWMGWVEHTLGNHPSAIAYFERCISLRDEVDDPMLFPQIEANIGMSYVMGARYALGQPLIERALSQMSAEDPHFQANAGYGLAHLAMMAGDQGDDERAERWLAQGLALIEASDHDALLGAHATMEGVICAFREDWDACRRVASRARAIAKRINGVYQAHMASMLEGLARVRGDHDMHGLVGMREAVLALESRGIGLALSFAFAMLAETLALYGDPDEAIAHADAALRRVEFGDALGEAVAYRARWLARRRKGDPAADEDFDACIRKARERQSPREEAVARRQHSAQVSHDVVT